LSLFLGGFMALTTKQELFVSAYCSNGYNGTKAAIEAGYSIESAGAISSENLQKPDIIDAIDRFKLSVAKRHGITVDGLLKELEEARTIALTCETPQTSAAVSATMSKAKLAGLDKQVIEHTGANGGPIEHKVEVSAADKFAEILNGLKD